MFFLDMNSSENHRSAVVNAMVYVHQTLHKANARALKRGGRIMAITPRHFLDFINHFVKLMKEIYMFFDNNECANCVTQLKL